jgi:hypothetical protein
MSKAKTLGVGLAGACALLMLSACVSPDHVADLDNRVGALESRVNAAEAKAMQLEATTNQCTATCNEVQERQARNEQMFQQNLRK